MRAKFQVLIIPYIISEKSIKYIIFRRKDMRVWQGLAGGGEDQESPMEAAKREANEEFNIGYDSKFEQLDSMSSVPAYFFKEASKEWGDEVFAIPEFSFAVEIQDLKNLKISDEHTKFKICTYRQARKMLKWESNKMALWELNERLKRSIE